VADLSLDKEMLQEVIRKNSEACPDAGEGGHLRSCFGVSIWCVFRAVPALRSAFPYRYCRHGSATAIGIHMLLLREGWMVNAKSAQQLYCLKGLPMRLKPPQWDDRNVATAPNKVWVMDWVYDQFFDGRRF